MSTAVYPTITVQGDARSRGRMYGALAREYILNTIEAYKRLFEHWGSLDWASAQQEAAKFIPAIEAYDAEIAEEMRGIAEGARVAFTEILTLNVRYEVVFASSMFRECTSAAAAPEVTENGHMIMGQNWDWMPAAADCCIVLKVEQPNRPSLVTFVEAGLVAKTGINSAGIALCANGLSSDEFKPYKVPMHVVLRGILNSSNMSDALSAVIRAERASSCNYLIGSKRGDMIDLETTASRVFHLYAANGCMGHANNFEYDQAAVNDLGKASFPDSILRGSRTRRLLSLAAGRINVQTFKDIFRDHVGWPNSICNHVNESRADQERIRTIGSVIYDLTDMRMWLADGNPCECEYREIPLNF